jgi:hypothetical protein
MRAFITSQGESARPRRVPLAALVALAMIGVTVFGTGAAPSQDVGDEGTPAVVRADEQSGGGGPHNVVRAHNLVDGRLLVRGRIQVNRISSGVVEPANYAEATSSCVACSTFAVALQIDLYQSGADVVAPQNAAVAVNAACSGCVSIARSLQYALPVDDPNETYDADAQELARELESELRAIQGDARNITARGAEERINNVIVGFQRLGLRLWDRRDEKDDDNSPTLTATPAPSITSASTATPTVATQNDAVAPAVTATPVASEAPTPVTAPPTPDSAASATPIPVP